MSGLLHFVAILAALLWSSHASFLDHDCPAVLSEADVSDNFAYSIVHGIHSITVDDLQYYFNSNASVNNSIPTINSDLLSNEAITFDAPKLNLTSNFTTLGMRVMDEVFSHMDDINWDGKNMRVVDRIYHKFHMHEMWADTKVFYDEMKTSGPVDKNVCDCLTDIELNGVYERMRMMALEIREPTIVYGGNQRSRSARMYRRLPQYRRRLWYRSLRKEAFGASRSAALLNVKGQPGLTSTAIWNTFKEEDLEKHPSMAKDLAKYLYCMLE